MTLKKTVVLVLLLLVLWSFNEKLFAKKNLTNPSRIILIANKNVAEDHFTKKEIQKIFLGKKKKWKDNSNIILIIPEEKNILKSLLKLIKKSQTQFDNTWKKLIFTGKSKAPIKMKKTEEIIQFVGKTKGALSVIPKMEIKDENVKIIQVREK